MAPVLVAVLAVVALWLLAPPRPRRYPARDVLGQQGVPRWRHPWPRLRGAGRRAEARADIREATAEFAAELTAGQPIRHALLRSYPESLAPRARAAARFGGDVAAAFRADAAVPGCELLGPVGACWSVAEGHGAGLAAALDRLVAQERNAEDVRVQLMAHLAAPRATSRMLAALPVIGLGMGYALGVDPVSWLIGSAVGLACLGLGLALMGLGLVWSQRIVRRVEALL